MTGGTQSEKSKREEFGGETMGMYERMVAWRKEHPEASYDEIASRLKGERKKLMGRMLEELAVQELEGERWQKVNCTECGEVMEHKGMRDKQVVHDEGEAVVSRPYYHCKGCRSGFSPLG